MHYQYILFDLDGTITESGPGIINSVRYAVQKMGYPALPDEKLRKFVGPPLADSMQKYCGMTPDEAKEAITCYREYYTSKGMFENKLYPGVEDMLRKLRDAGKTLALATSKPEVFAKQILEYFQLGGFFETVCGASLDEKLVEKAAIIANTLQSLGIDEAHKKDVLMVGDREHDVLGAKANGLDALGVLYGYGDLAELTQAGAAYIAQTAEEAADLVLGEIPEEAGIIPGEIPEEAGMIPGEIPEAADTLSGKQQEISK